MAVRYNTGAINYRSSILAGLRSEGHLDCRCRTISNIEKKLVKSIGDRRHPGSSLFWSGDRQARPTPIEPAAKDDYLQLRLDI